MEISIILLNYKTKRLLRQCLKGIYLCPPSVSFEVVVVDNGSRDGTVEMVTKEFPQVKFVELPKNTGYAHGSNVGIQAATGKYFLFLNTDIVVLQGGIDVLYNYLVNNSKVGIVGPHLTNPDGSLQESAYRFHRFLTPVYQRSFLKKTSRGRREVDRFLMRDWNHDTARSVDWLMSSCFMVRVEALNKVGLFDERFFVYLADTDLCRRFWLQKFAVHYIPNTTFIHYHRRQSAEDLRVTLIHAHDWAQYLLKWRGQKPPSTSSF